MLQKLRADRQACGATTIEYRYLGLSSFFDRGLLARRFMAQMAQKYQRPIWLTEFACGLAGSIQILTQVMKSMLTMLDNQPMVARCAQFHHTPRRAGAHMMAYLCGANMMVFMSTLPALNVPPKQSACLSPYAGPYTLP